MHAVFACVFEEHNLWLVLVATLVCVGACAGAFFVLGGALGGTAQERVKWLSVAATLAGGGTWATHFIAMLGYMPNLWFGFDLFITMLSAGLCIALSGLALEVYARWRSGAGRVVAGLGLGAAITSMHYVGMAGLNAAAQKLWQAELVIASGLFCAVFSIAALEAFATAPRRFRLLAASALLSAAIVSLHFTGMGALRLLPDPSIVFEARTLNREWLAAVVAGGAAAFLLVGVVLALADRQVAATKLAAAQSAAAMALHDALTGLPNRRYLEQELPRRLPVSSDDAPLAVVAVDLDRFKPVNDLYGHATGDQLLICIAESLSRAAGAQGFAARLGGDEFIMLIPYADKDALIGELAALVRTFEAPLLLGGKEVSIGATLGVALAPSDGVMSDILLRRADMALYRAKEQGRGRFAFFEPGMDERVQARAALENDLRIAIRNGAIEAYFQPVVKFASGEVSGYEVLARWNHPTRGAVPPEIFVKLAEETGLIGELCLKVLHRACRQSLGWPGAPKISLNIAPIQLRDPILPQNILKILTECGFPPQRLEIEITEDALVFDYEAAKAILISFKNLGVAVVLDDFGAGFSSLRHLRELPFDELKIDRSFVSAIADSEEAQTFVKTIIELAKSLGLAVCAEGVETKAQAQALIGLGCETGQGFLLGRPSAGPASLSIERRRTGLG